LVNEIFEETTEQGGFALRLFASYRIPGKCFALRVFSTSWLKINEKLTVNYRKIPDYFLEQHIPYGGIIIKRLERLKK